MSIPAKLELGGEHRRADDLNEQSFCDGLQVRLAPLCDHAECLFTAPRRSDCQHSERRIKRIAPGVGDISARGDRCAGGGVKSFIAVEEACRALQNDKMLILVAMNVYGCAVTRLRYDFDNRASAGGVGGSCTDQTTLSGARLQ